jgi:hypothetical protein
MKVAPYFNYHVGASDTDSSRALFVCEFPGSFPWLEEGRKCAVRKRKATTAAGHHSIRCVRRYFDVVSTQLRNLPVANGFKLIHGKHRRLSFYESDNKDIQLQLNYHMATPPPTTIFSGTDVAF